MDIVDLGNYFHTMSNADKVHTVDILTIETSNRNVVSKHSLFYFCFDLFIINCLLIFFNLFNEIQLKIVTLNWILNSFQIK